MPINLACLISNFILAWVICFLSVLLSILFFNVSSSLLASSSIPPLSCSKSANLFWEEALGDQPRSGQSYLHQASSDLARKPNLNDNELSIQEVEVSNRKLKKITRPRSGIQRIIEADGWWLPKQSYRHLYSGCRNNFGVWVVQGVGLLCVGEFVQGLPINYSFLGNN